MKPTASTPTPHSRTGPEEDRPWIVLICGPYLSGTDGDEARIAANRARLESMALPIYERGHLPMIGEWLALPVARAAGSRSHDDAVFAAYQYPVAQRLLQRCDALLRLEGASRGADLDVARARELGLPVFTDVDQLPRRAAGTVSGTGASSAP